MPTTRRSAAASRTCRGTSATERHRDRARRRLRRSSSRATSTRPRRWQLTRAPLPRPPHGRSRAERPAGDGGQLARLERRAHVPLPHPRGRALERRRAASTAEDFAFAWSACARRRRRPRSCSRTSSRPRRSTTGRSRFASREPRSYFPTSSPSPGRSPGRSTRARSSATTGASPRTSSRNGPFVLAELDDEHALLTQTRTGRDRAGTSARSTSRFAEHGERARRRVAGARRLRRPPACWTASRADGAGHARRRRPEARHATTSASAPTGAPFSNELVRKAFSHAIDRDGCCEPGRARAPRRRGRRDPAGDAGALPSSRARVRPRARAPAARGRRLSGRQGPARAQDARPAPGSSSPGSA